MTALLGDLDHRAGPCPVCGGRCVRFPDVDHLATYPFLPGGRDPMADKDYVIAPHRIVDREIGRVMYGTGERVPMADAIKYGLVGKVPVEKAPKKQAPKRGKRGPVEDRARKPSEDR